MLDQSVVTLSNSAAFAVFAMVAAGLMSATIVWLAQGFTYAVHRVERRTFDRRCGVDTGGVVRKDRLDIEGANKSSGNHCMPTPVRTMRSILKGLSPDLADFTFVDFGSGMARAILVAAEFQFRRVIGVELSPELTRIAKENINSYKNQKQQCFDLSALCADATEFEIPDDQCIFYFFNPFGPRVLKQVAENIKRSHAARPRKMYVILYHPRNTEIIQDLGIFKRICPKGANTDIFEIYESVQ
jgi:SAM-dependent methyltransferase